MVLRNTGFSQLCGSVLSFLHCLVLTSTDFSVVVLSADLLSAAHKGGSVTAVSQGGSCEACQVREGGSS